MIILRLNISIVPDILKVYGLLIDDQNIHKFHTLTFFGLG